MKKLKLNRNTFAGAEVLTRLQLKKVMGGNGSTTTGVGCSSHSDCGGMFPICVIVTYQGVTQGACCNSEQIHDPNNVCGGGTEI